MKTCKLCGLEKPESDFHKDRQKTDGLAPYCKPCLIAKQREYQSRPPRKVDPAPEGHRTCQRCKAVKPLTEYGRNSNRHDGLSLRCKTCQYELHRDWALKFPEKAAALQKKWREANPDRSKDHGLKGRYGLPLGTFNEMLAAQNYACAICKGSHASKGRLHVDHCHDTGCIRGLLCHGCNVSLGHFKHDVEILQAAISYLSESRTEG